MPDDKEAAESGEILALNLLIMKINDVLIQAGEDVLDGTDLTVARSRLLGILVRAERPLTMFDIYRELRQSRQATSTLVRRMSRDGLVRAQANPHHKRSFLVALTARGMEAYLRSNDRQLAILKALDRASAAIDKRQALDVLNRYYAAVSEVLETRQAGMQPAD